MTDAPARGLEERTMSEIVVARTKVEDILGDELRRRDDTITRLRDQYAQLVRERAGEENARHADAEYARGLRGEVAQQAATIAVLTTALRELSDAILRVHDSPKYRAVWELAMIHGQPYSGPTYEHELTRARALLAPAAREGTS
jgi:hypothetical protein